MKKNQIKALPERQRPYERFYHEGPDVLSDQELLAILIVSGYKGSNSVETATSILAELGTNEGISELAKASIEDLMQIKGIGMKKAIRIKAAFEISNRSISGVVPNNLDCSNPENIVQYFKHKMESLEREELRALFLNKKNILIREKLISTGGLSSTIVYPRDVFKEALRANAAALILIHNHPSGNSRPSQDDKETTRKFIEAGKLLGVRLHDHIIFGKGEYVSLASEHPYNYIFQ